MINKLFSYVMLYIDILFSKNDEFDKLWYWNL